MKKKKVATDNDWAWALGETDKGPEPSLIEEQARMIVDGKRQEDYGTPQANHERTGLLWDAYQDARGIGYPLTPTDVCFMNILQKISREMHSPTRDGLTDIIGYAINIAKLRGYE